MGRPRKRRRDAADLDGDGGGGGEDGNDDDVVTEAMTSVPALGGGGGDDTSLQEFFSTDLVLRQLPSPAATALALDAHLPPAAAASAVSPRDVPVDFFSGDFSWLNRCVACGVVRCGVGCGVYGVGIRGGADYVVCSEMPALDIFHIESPVPALDPSMMGFTPPQSDMGTPPGAIPAGMSIGMGLSSSSSSSSTPLTHDSDWHPWGDIGMITGVVPCKCLPSFFQSITALHMIPPASAFTLPYILQVARTALGTARTCIHCDYCQRGPFAGAYTANMMMGCMLPLLIMFFQKSFESIDRTEHDQTVVVGDGQEVILDVAAWRDMARAALKKEFGGMMEVVNGLEQRAKERHANRRGRECGRAVVVNGVSTAGDQPLCQKIVSTIKSVAARLTID